MEPTGGLGDEIHSIHDLSIQTLIVVYMAVSDVVHIGIWGGKE